jgi:hypothetical protein
MGAGSFKTYGGAGYPADGADGPADKSETSLAIKLK